MSSAINPLAGDANFAECLLADLPRLRRAQSRLAQHRHHHRAAAAPPALAQEKLLQLIAQSQAKVSARRAAVPDLIYPPGLPVSAARQQIAEALNTHQVIVLAGETGSGKSTQLPKICLEIGRGVRGFIGHTQPRRLAARTLAARIATELNSSIGSVVGYKVRFNEQTAPQSLIKLMTDGILLAELAKDHDLLAYDTLIIDEAHERSLNIDFLLGYVHGLCARRPDLKIIITSATIDTARFAEHFQAPVIQVSGRSYPVELRYHPLAGDADRNEADPGDDEPPDIAGGVCATLKDFARCDLGDVLVFLPGEREIRDCTQALGKLRLPDTDILPLYSRLSVADQQKIFAAHQRRHVVLATNVAETSITVPGIKVVIDSGLARVSRYSTRLKVQRLPVEKISRASADQRAGRCGRTAPGICVRLYTQEDYDARPQYTEPEIRRTNLAAVILQLLASGWGEIEDFPFIEPPDARYISDGYRLLHELGAVDERRQLTTLGKQLARFPLDPRIARLLFAAREENCLGEMLIIAAALSIPDPRDLPLSKESAVAERQAAFHDPRSDFIWFLRFWQAYQQDALPLSNRKRQAFCHASGVSPLRLREWQDVHAQLQDSVREHGWRVNTVPADYAALHRALCAGFLSQVAMRENDKEYTGARGIKPLIFPGSILFKQPPKWWVSANLVETSRLYARMVAQIEPEWLEQYGAHLIKKTYSEPHWNAASGRVSVNERQTLLGLPVSAGKRVDYARIDRAAARQIFIMQGLVADHHCIRAPFVEHNRVLLKSLKVLEHKVRRLDLLAGEAELFAFYDVRLPPEITSQQALEKWLRGAPTQSLFLFANDVLRDADVDLSAYPDEWLSGDLRLPLRYEFDPGSDADGITVEIPSLLLNQLSAAQFEWLIPPLLTEKVTALLKVLPKVTRRQLAPLQDAVSYCRSRLQPQQGGLLAQLQILLAEYRGVNVAPHDFDVQNIPAHLQLRFRVLSHGGEVLAAGRDLAALQGKLGAQARDHFAASQPTPASGSAWQSGRSGVTRWDFGDIPALTPVRQGQLQISAYPALADQQTSVALVVSDTAAHAQRITRDGVRRLLMLECHQQVKYLKQNLPDFALIAMKLSSRYRAEILKSELIEAVFEHAFLSPAVELRTQAEFARVRDAGRQQVISVANVLSQTLLEIAEAYHDLQKQLDVCRKPLFAAATAEIETQLAEIFAPQIFRQQPLTQIQQFPRYLKSLRARLQKLPRDPARDQQRADEWYNLARPYREQTAMRRTRGDPLAADWLAFRWLLSEWWVSLFAQELGTAQPVSMPRLKKEWLRLQGK